MERKKISTRKTLLTVMLGIAVLFVAQVIAYALSSITLFKNFSSIIYAILYIVMTYLGVKAVSERFLGEDMKSYGLTKEKFKVKWLIAGIILPTAVSLILIITGGNLIKNNFPIYKDIYIILRAVFVSGIAVGFCEELVFRGLIMRVLEKRWGIVIAAGVPSMIFACLHYNGSLGITDFFMLLFAGTSVGIMFSLIAYKSGSILNSAVVHGLWNVVMIGNIINIAVSHSEYSIFSYDLSQSSLILTGGRFGVESSIFAISGYLIIIFLIILKNKKLDIYES